MPKKVEKKTPPKSQVKPAVKKNQKKPVKTKEPKITEAMFEAWFFGLNSKLFAQMQKEWNERNLKVDLEPQRDYDGYLDYFKTLPPSTIRLLITTGQGTLTTEAYAALLRWADILSNPHRIEKIHQAGLSNNGTDKGKGIVELARENDVLGVLKATRDRLAEKLSKGAGARDTAALAREMTDVMAQIATYEKKQAPSKTTKLGQLMGDMEPLKKRPGKNGNGRRNTSFSSRVTIDDLEAND